MNKIKYFTWFFACFVIVRSNAQEVFTVINLELLNSSHLDFSPVPYKDGVLFTSTRDNDCKCKDKANDDNFTDLFYGDVNMGVVKSVRGDLNGKKHDGVATISSNGNTMYITRTNKSGKRKDNVKDCKIYRLVRDGETWTDDGEFPYNSNEFATVHPSLSADGKRLYFSSNRKGSIGGMDLWVCTKGNDGKWSEPANLGPTVNTTGNEVFPFITENNDLYFASNGQKEAQKLDIYKASGEGYSTITRLPAPINTESDDFGFSMINDGTRGYLSSNRIGGKGGDDIYTWYKDVAPTPVCLLSVIDAKTEDQIGTPTVTISAPGLAPVTSTDDVVTLMPDPNLTYTIVVKKPGYDPKTITVKGADLMATPEYKVPIVSPNKPVVATITAQPAKIIVKSRPTQENLANAKVRVEKQCDGKKSEFVTSGFGDVSFSIDCGCTFKVTASRDGYSESSKTFTAAACDNPQPTTAIVELEPYARQTPVSTFEGTELKKGAIITLKDIYYDYDKYYIRPDAAKVLDKVVNLMNQYPSLEVELASHTDCRGNNQYNQTLSQNRATSAVKYIVSKGIESRRLVAAGYGETQLKNECADGVKCSETQHQENRRTEIRVTRFEESNVEIRKE